MDNPIIITLISAGTAAFITGILNIITKLIDNHSQKAERKENKIAKYYEEKKNAYIRALDKLLFIKRGLSITKEDLRNSTDLFDQISEESSDLKYADSFFRLYASDKVFNFYFSLLQKYKPYSYVSESSWRLSEDSKVNFDAGISILSRLMQEDLGYRSYDDEKTMIKCPKCGKEHDFVNTCKCGLTFPQLQEELLKIRNEQLIKKEQ